MNDRTHDQWHDEHFEGAHEQPAQELVGLKVETRVVTRENGSTQVASKKTTNKSKEDFPV
jgi:hypothetical protein